MYTTNLDRIPAPYNERGTTRRQVATNQNRESNHAGEAARDRARRALRRKHDRNR